MSDGPEARWSFDPAGKYDERWWGGDAWTERVRKDGVETIAPAKGHWPAPDSRRGRMLANGRDRHERLTSSTSAATPTPPLASARRESTFAMAFAAMFGSLIAVVVFFAVILAVLLVLLVVLT